MARNIPTLNKLVGNMTGDETLHRLLPNEILETVFLKIVFKKNYYELLKISLAFCCNYFYLYVLNTFLMYFLCKWGDLQLMRSVSVHVSRSSVMT